MYWKICVLQIEEHFSSHALFFLNLTCERDDLVATSESSWQHVGQGLNKFPLPMTIIKKGEENLCSYSNVRILRIYFLCYKVPPFNLGLNTLLLLVKIQCMSPPQIRKGFRLHYIHLLLLIPVYQLYRSILLYCKCRDSFEPKTVLFQSLTGLDQLYSSFYLFFVLFDNHGKNDSCDTESLWNCP
jgi:hypothetical protein